jgi:hypothetical protein
MYSRIIEGCYGGRKAASGIKNAFLPFGRIAEIEAQIAYKACNLSAQSSAESTDILIWLLPCSKGCTCGVTPLSLLFSTHNPLLMQSLGEKFGSVDGHIFQCPAVHWDTKRLATGKLLRQEVAAEMCQRVRPLYFFLALHRTKAAI